jgi:hypothetical protein
MCEGFHERFTRMKKFSRPRMNTRSASSRWRQHMCNKEYIVSPLLTHSSWKYIQNFAIINGEGERPHGAAAGRGGCGGRQRVGRGGRQHLGEELRACDRQQFLSACLPPFLRQRASRQPLSDISESHRRAALVLPAGHRHKWSSP